jgi:hypothetical protein
MRRARAQDATSNEGVVSTRHQRVFSGAADGSLFGWNLAGPVPPAFRAWDSNAGATRAVFSADGKRVWVPEDGSTCVLLDVATLAPVARAADMRYPLALLSGQLIGVAVSAGIVRVDANTGQLVGRQMTSNPLRIAAVSGDGRQIAAIDNRHNLLTAHDTESRRVAEDFQWYATLMFNESGDRLWLSSPTRREMLALGWPGGQILSRTSLPARTATFLQLPNSQQPLVALDNGNLEVRSANTGALLREIYAGSPAPQTLGLSSDGRRLFVGGLNGDIHCFDPTSWEELHVLSLGGGLQLHHLACSPDGTTLAALTRTGALYLVRTE